MCELLIIHYTSCPHTDHLPGQLHEPAIYCPNLEIIERGVSEEYDVCQDCRRRAAAAAAAREDEEGGERGEGGSAGGAAVALKEPASSSSSNAVVNGGEGRDGRE
jgi:hypothetical protein